MPLRQRSGVASRVGISSWWMSRITEAWVVFIAICFTYRRGASGMYRGLLV